ncbi:J domain-containing protein [Haloarcula sp. NS06]|uniref:J domain-containing protein n=1 Tax=Haloarcula sp. NS06 TaxID=3409688 RepID=UPI003DA7699F
MDIDEAYKYLNVDEDTTLESVERRYAKLAKEYHPDQGGDPEEFKKLIEARNKIRENIRNQDIRLYEDTGVVETSNSNYSKKKEKTKKTINRIERRQTSKYRRVKQYLLPFTVLAGVISLINILKSLVQPNIVFPAIPFVRGEIMAPILIVLCLYFGAIYWYLRTKVRNLELMITEIEEVLDQKSNIVRLLSDLNADFNQDSISEENLEKAISDWMGQGSSSPTFIFSFMSPNLDMHSIANKIGSGDFNRILLRKCIENNILEEEIGSRGSEDWEVSYKIKLGAD